MKLNSYLVALVCGAPLVSSVSSVPAIPEPPVMVYGTVADVTTQQLMAITAVMWQVTDGVDSATLTLASTPSARIVTRDGQSYFVLEVPFETRVIKSSPTQTIALTRQGQSFELKSPAPTYTLTPFINGRAATIKSVNGTPASGPSLSLTNDPASNGQQLRVDLTLPPQADSYETWVAVHFPNPAAPEAARTADPDGDGATNEQEYLAGTDPRNRASVLNLLSSAWLPNGDLTLNFLTTPGRRYRLLATTDLITYTLAAPPFLATATTTTINAGPGQRRFFRLEIVVDTYEAWQSIHFPQGGANAAPSADPDADGVNNQDEFAAGTNPHDPASLFTFVSSAWQSNGSLVLTYTSVPGRQYQLLGSDDLISFSPIGAPVVATRTTNPFTVSSNQLRRYYKATVSIP